MWLCFFFQAEDGIRGGRVTGVQTCALPIWHGWQRLVSVAQRAGVDFFGLTYGTRDGLQAMRFGKGSFMLDWNGKGGAFIFETEDGDPYNPAWVADLGRPLRPKVEVQPGVWRRRYERGLVLVNTNTALVTVPIAGTPT